MSQFPTTKTVPLDKDIGVSDSKSYIGTGAREQLSVVLDTLTTKVQTNENAANAAVAAEQAARIAADNSLQTQITNEVNNRVADVDAEEAARIAADIAETSARTSADSRLQSEIDGERAPLRMSVTGTNALVSVAAAFGLSRTDASGNSNVKLAVPNGSLLSDFKGAQIDFGAGTITYLGIAGYGDPNTVIDSFTSGSFTNITPITNDVSLQASALAAEFTASADFKINQGTLRVFKNGNPDGSVVAKIIRSAGGLPSTNPSDLIASSTPIPCSSIVNGTDVTFQFNNELVAPAGVYHLVIEGDPVYKASSNNFYNSGSGNWIDIARATGTGQTRAERRQNSNGVWQNMSTSTTLFSVKGAPFQPNTVENFNRISFAGQPSKWAKYAIVLLPTSPNTVLMIPGDGFGTTLDSVPAPAFDGGVAIGIVGVQDNGSAGLGTIQNIAEGNLYQFLASGSGSGGGAGSGSPLDPQADETFAFYTRSDFGVDKRAFLDSTTGSDQILGLKKITLNVGQQFLSKDLTGPQIAKDALTINRVQVRLLYNIGKVDENPTVQISRDGGLNWTSALVVLPGSISASRYESNLVLAETTFSPPVTPRYNGGTASGNTFGAHQAQAQLISPSYRTIVEAFKVQVKLDGAATGIIQCKIHQCSGAGIPQSVLATSREKFTVGQEVVASAFNTLTFTFDPTVIEPGTLYAFSIESPTPLSANILTNKSVVGSAPSYNQGTVYNEGSGWVRVTDNSWYEIFGSGLDLRIKVVSSTGGSELAGFGVNFVEDLGVQVTGQAAYEERFITAAEASTGLITLSQAKFTPGSRQIQVNHNGHIFMAPDFVELSPTQLQFPANFFQAGDFVRFFTGFGIVDGTSQALSKLAAQWDAIIGSVEQVAAGVANYASLQSAITALPTGAKILLLDTTLSENVTVNKKVLIEGRGHNSKINGTLTFLSSADFSAIRSLRFGGDVTLSGNGVFVSDCWIASSASIIETTPNANSIRVIQE